MGLLKTFLEKSFSVGRFGKDWLDRLLGSLADAARSISYIETVNPSQADTLHREIKRSDERWLKRGFEACVRFALLKLPFRNRKVKVAIDTTEDPYWGKNGCDNTRPPVHEISNESWQWTNLSIVEPYFVPLMSLPYRQTDDLDEVVFELLEYLQTLPLHIELVLFDRGFYHWRLIDYLNGSRRGWSWPYLIFVPKNEAMQRFIEQTDGAFAVYRHQGQHKADKTKWCPETTIVILKGATKNKLGEPIDWCFATNQRAHLGLVKTYMKRWNIETGFRIHDEGKIKTKSADPLVRFFYHLVSMLFILIWRLQRVTLPMLSFKRQLKLIEMSFCEETKPPPWTVAWMKTVHIV